MQIHRVMPESVKTLRILIGYIIWQVKTAILNHKKTMWLWGKLHKKLLHLLH